MLVNEIVEPDELQLLIGERLPDLLIELANGVSTYIASSNGAKNPKPPFKKTKKKKEKAYTTNSVPDGKGGTKLIKVAN